MKKFILFIIILGIAKIHAQDSLKFFPIIQKTAFTLNKKQLTKDLWQPWAYGLTNKIELQSYVLLNFTMPNFGSKILLKKHKKFTVSSNHHLTYLSSWLKFWQGDGTGSIITPQIKINSMLQIENGVNLSYLLNSKHIFTSNLNHVFVLGSKINQIYSVDLPLVYQRFAPAFIGGTFGFKNNIQGKIYKRLNYIASADLYFVNRNNGNYFAETGAMVVYAKTNKFKSMLGCKLIYGQYPFGNQYNLIPNFNLIYTH